MYKLNLIQKLDDAISSLKEEVEKNDGSTLSTIANTVKAGFDNVSDSVMNNKTTQSFVDTFKKVIYTWNILNNTDPCFSHQVHASFGASKRMR